MKGPEGAAPAHQSSLAELRFIMSICVGWRGKECSLEAMNNHVAILLVLQICVIQEISI